MLSIVVSLEEFWSMLLGANIHVFTGHKTLTSDDLTTQWVLYWHNKIEKFLLEIYYIESPWKVLVVVDTLCRLDCLPSPSHIVGGKKLVETVIVSDDEDDNEAFLAEYGYSGMLDDGINAMLEFYLNLPDILDPAQNPFSFVYMCKQQQQDQQLR